MFIRAEVVVVLWFLPVVLNIVLPLVIGSIILLRKLLLPDTQPLAQAATVPTKESEKQIQDVPPRAMPV